VVSREALRGYVRVAHGTLLVAGVFHGVNRNGVYRSRPIVPALPEGLGNQHAPRNQERDHGEKKHSGQARDLLRHAVDTLPSLW
jgi:hypothetical protein